MNRAAPWVGLGLTACVTLKDPTDAIPPALSVPDGGPGVVQQPADGGLTPVDASKEPTPNAYAARQMALAKKRTRFGEVPENWVTSATRLYMQARGGAITSFRAADGRKVTYTGATAINGSFAVTDDYIACPNANDGIDIYASDDANRLVTTVAERWEIVGVAPNKFAIARAARRFDKDGTELVLLDPTAPHGIAPLPVTFFPVKSVRPGRPQGPNVVYVDFTGSTGWIVDTSTSVTKQFSFSQFPAFFEIANNAITTQYVSGTKIGFSYVPEKGLSRDLLVEILATESVVPKQLRTATGTFVQFGDWLIYAAAGGLLAFNTSDKRLIPCQIRLDSDLFLMQRPTLLGNVLVFSIVGGEEQGLYGVSLPELLAAENK
jgi:hypothetical protein